MSISPQMLGKYKLLDSLGSGGMAEVWKAQDTQLHRFVAIKLLHANLRADRSFLARFEREAQLIATLQHPNIVQLYDYQTFPSSAQNEPIAYMVMAYIEGQTLAQYLESTSHQGHYLSPEEIVRLFTAISSAVDYAHRQGMVHRDIKPANILLDRHNTTHNAEGEPILTDFGIARLLGTSTTTSYQNIAGTPGYMSPEQVHGGAGNELSDIYSLGIILYEMTTGVLPFRDVNVYGLMMQHVNATPVSPSTLNPTLPQAVSDVILTAIAKDPANRFSNASALTVALATAFQQPIPEELRQRALHTNIGNEATHYKPLHSNTVEPTASPHNSPSFSPAIDSLSAMQTASPVNQAQQPHMATISPVRQHPRVPDPETPAPLLHQYFQARPQRKKRRGIFLLLSGLLLLLLFASFASAWILIRHKSPVTIASTNPVVGHVYFLNSGQLDNMGEKGAMDELQIELRNIPPPATGKSYYAWLSNNFNQGDASYYPLGAVSVSHGNISAIIISTVNGGNLLARYSSFLLTEEDTSVTPVAPTPDLSNWRYSATLPQQPDPKDKIMHGTVLMHLQHLLSNESNLQSWGLDGGLALWFYRNTEKLFEWTISARDYNPPRNGDIDFIRRQTSRVIAYLDGAGKAQKELPLAYQNDFDQTLSTMGLLGINTSNPTEVMLDELDVGYLYAIIDHLDNLVACPGATQEQLLLATQIASSINTVIHPALIQLRQDAMQIVKMSNAQLLQPQAQSMLNDMVAQTQIAYGGHYIPDTNTLQPGAFQIYYLLQRLAAFNVQPYTQQ